MEGSETNQQPQTIQEVLFVFQMPAQSSATGRLPTEELCARRLSLQSAYPIDASSPPEGTDSLLLARVRRAKMLLRSRALSLLMRAPGALSRALRMLQSS